MLKRLLEAPSILIRTATALGMSLGCTLGAAGADAPKAQPENAGWPAQGIEFIVAVQLPSDTDAAARTKAVNAITDIQKERLRDMKIAFQVEQAPEDRVVVRVPILPEQTIAGLRKALTRTGYIEFRLVHPEGTGSTDPNNGPIGYEQLSLVTRQRERDFTEVLWVKRIPELTGDTIERANVMMDSYSSYIITVTFDAKGRSRFASVTRALAEARAETGQFRRLAIVVDGTLITAPMVHDEITGGVAQIAGSFSRREAEELANLLNNPLEARLRIEQQRPFGPTPN